MKNTSSPLIAYKRGPSLDSSVWYMGSLLTFLAERKDTDGAFALVEYSAKPGNEPPPHLHEREDELYYILEGEIDAYVENQAFKLTAGECFFLPKLKPHTFIIRSPRFRALFLVRPAGVEGYFHGMSLPARKLELPTGAITYSTSDLEHAIRLGEKYGIRFLSPDEVAQQMPSYLAALSKKPVLNSQPLAKLS